MGFGSNYTGNPNAVEPPSAAPGSAVFPTVYLAADLDGASWANVSQALKVLADFSAFYNKTGHFYAPLLPVASSGFTAVTHTGTDTGTVVPTDSGIGAAFKRAPSGANFVIKIIASGAVGVATYAISVDGGNTYGSTSTVTSGTDLTTGMTLTFANHFTAGETYSFGAAVSPQVYFGDGVSGQALGRFLVDHMGYPMGKLTIFDEPWMGPTGTLSQAAPIVNFQRWSGSHESTVGAIIQLADPTVSYQARSAVLDGNGDAVVGNLTLNTVAPIVNFGGAGAPANALVLQFDLWEDKGQSAALDDSQARLGVFFSDALPTTTFGTGANIVGVYKPSGANQPWTAITSNGASQQTTTTGLVANSTTAVQRVRIEMHGSGSIFGAFTTLFFWNEALVAAHSASYPTVSNAASIYIQNRNVVGGNNKVALHVGQLRVVCNPLAPTATQPL